MTTVSYPSAPALEGLQGTLLDAAEVETGVAWLEGADLYPTYAGMTFGASADFCAPNTITFDNTLAWVDGFRFVAFGGVTCSLVGLDRAEFEREVEKVFMLGESTAVERALMDIRFQAKAGVDGWPAPVDLTPAGGAVKPGVGVAILEGYSASVYVGVPTLHMPRVIASLLLGVDGADLDNKVIRSKLGSKIAAGAGYDYPNTGPDGTQPAATERWIYATGNVLLRGGQAKPVTASDLSTNDHFILAQRAYVGAVDTFAAAVRVQVTS